MPSFTIVYTSDIHGNEIQYNKLHDFAKRASADAVIIGGDIAPKGIPNDIYIQTQRNFLKKKLPEFAKNLKKSLPKCNLFLMMGNDDCATNMDVLEKQDSKLYTLIHNKRIKLANDFDIVGYGCVPITPFGIKDWEKFDLSDPPQHFLKEYMKRLANDANFQGYKTSKGQEVPFIFTSEMMDSDSIQKDLEGILFTAKPNKTVYVMHTPPYGTNLDLVGRNGHIGSMAVKMFIEKKQPYLTLHGHIHNTVDVSGQFKHQIGKALSLSSGNCNTKNDLALLVFDLYNPKTAKRLVI